jgi:hypothetical protein
MGWTRASRRNVATAVAARVTLVTMAAVVNIAGHFIVFVVGPGLTVLVAACAGELGIIRAVRMARRAARPNGLVPPRIDREVRAIMGSEPGPAPLTRIVTLQAICTEICCDVIGIHGARIVRLMAEVAIGRRIGVLSIDMALNAINRDMRSGQGELRLTVIECRRLPGNGIMALRTGLAE